MRFAEKTFQPGPSFGPKVLPMSSEQSVTYVSGPDRRIWSGRGDLNARPPAPKAGALPGCATPRLSTYLILNHFLGRCKDSPRCRAKRMPTWQRSRTTKIVRRLPQVALLA